MTKLLPLLFALLLLGCNAAEPVTAQEVFDRFVAAGLDVTAEEPEETTGGMMPKSFKERFLFSVPEVAPRGGQILVCDTKRNCDALVAYLGAWLAVVGPYVYQSPSGLVVVQINSGLTPDHAARFEAIVKALP